MTIHSIVHSPNFYVVKFECPSLEQHNLLPKNIKHNDNQFNKIGWDDTTKLSHYLATKTPELPNIIL